MPGRAVGKSALMTKMENEFLKKNPEATILRIKPKGEIIIEKFIGSNRRIKMGEYADLAIEESLINGNDPRDHHEEIYIPKETQRSDDHKDVLEPPANFNRT